MDPGGAFFDQPNKIKTFKIVSYVISFVSSSSSTSSLVK